MSIHACKSCSLSVLNFITHPPACSIFILLRGPPGTLPLPFGAKVRRMGNRKSAFQAEIEGETRRSRKTFTSPHDDGAADGPCNGSTFHFASSLVRLMVVLGACGIIVCFRSYTRREHTKRGEKGKENVSLRRTSATAKKTACGKRERWKQIKFPRVCAGVCSITSSRLFVAIRPTLAVNRRQFARFPPPTRARRALLCRKIFCFCFNSFVRGAKRAE